MADLERLQVGVDQLVLALESLAQQRFDDAKLDVEQRRKRADINDVLVQLALSRVGIFGGADSVSGMPRTSMSSRVRSCATGRVES